jgi:hypothetical protein
MKIRHGFPKVLAAIAQSALATAIAKATRDKRIDADTPHGVQLRTRQDARREAHDLLAALARQESVAQFAFSRGWEPPLWCGTQDELNREASAWLDARWQGALNRKSGGDK